MKIANLHTHTEFSNVSCGFKDSTNKVGELLDYAYDNDHAGIGVTDHESVTAHIRAFDWWENKIKSAETEEEKEKAENFKVVLGNEIYLAREDLTAENHQQGESFFHFLLLAKNAEGQQQLRELSSMAWERSYMRNVMRRFNFVSDLKEIIGKNQGNVVATSACLGNIAGHAFLTMERSDAEATVDGYVNLMNEIFGEGNFYLELSPALYQEQIDYNQFLYERYAEKLPFVITNDVHYLEKEDFRTLQVLLGEDRESENYYKYAHFMTWEEIVKNMNYIPTNFLKGAAQNALDIVASSERYSLKHEQKIPTVPYKKTEVPQELLEEAQEHEFIKKFIHSEFPQDRQLIAEVLTNYLRIDGEINTDKRRKEVFERINLELGELWGIGKIREDRISDYLLTMSWVIKKMWESGTLVGPGRGSAVAFIINYYLEITDVNPIDYPLEIPHWRLTH